MTERKQEWPSGRIVHLFGGCRAINISGPTVDLDPYTLDGKHAQFQLKSYGSIYTVKGLPEKLR